MSKIYVVVYSGGDYIGYFDTEILGAFTKEQDAIECKQRGKSIDTWSGNSHITIEECDLI